MVSYFRQSELRLYLPTEAFENLSLSVRRHVVPQILRSRAEEQSMDDVLTLFELGCSSQFARVRVRDSAWIVLLHA